MTTTHTQPDWLRQAEAAREERETARLQKAWRRAQAQADQINTRLADLGIQPVTPASVHQREYQPLQPALLVAADPEHELYAVYASHDGDNVVLEVDHYWGEWPAPRRGPALRTVDDVLDARHYGVHEPLKEPLNSLRALALATVDRLSGDMTVDGYGIGEQISGLTAAVLHLADTLTTQPPTATRQDDGQDDGAGLVGTQQAVCHIAVCGVCGYAWDEDGEYGAYHYSSPEEAIRGATSEDPEHAFKQLPDGSLLCRRSDRAHQQVLGAVLATEAETRLHERLAADGQERITTDHPHT